jgi:hypothetical protein
MEVFRELSINIEPERMAAMADLIGRSLPAGWTRDRVTEETIRVAQTLNAGPTYCFTCEQDSQRPAATLILAERPPGAFSVSNIMPLTKHRLAHGEYNAILEDFYERVLRPHTDQAGVTVSLTGNQVELEHWMSAATAELLRRFSASANRGTGSSHPNDRARWNAFVVAAHRDHSEMDASDLHRWLIEVARWAPEVAQQLALEYEYGRELLAFADAHRRSA